MPSHLSLLFPTPFPAAEGPLGREELVQGVIQTWALRPVKAFEEGLGLAHSRLKFPVGRGSLVSGLLKGLTWVCSRTGRPHRGR